MSIGCLLLHHRLSELWLCHQDSAQCSTQTGEAGDSPGVHENMNNTPGELGQNTGNPFENHQNLAGDVHPNRDIARFRLIYEPAL